MQTTATSEVLIQWDGTISGEIAKIFKRNGITIDRRCEPAAIEINPKTLRTPERLVAAFEIGNTLRGLMLSDRTKIQGKLRNDG